MRCSDASAYDANMRQRCHILQRVPSLLHGESERREGAASLEGHRWSVVPGAEVNLLHLLETNLCGQLARSVLRHLHCVSDGGETVPRADGFEVAVALVLADLLHLAHVLGVEEVVRIELKAL